MKNVILGLMATGLSFAISAAETPNHFVCKNANTVVTYSTTSLSGKPLYTVEEKKGSKSEIVKFNGKLVSGKNLLGHLVSNSLDERDRDGDRVDYTLILPGVFNTASTKFTAPFLKTANTSGMYPTPVPYNSHSTVVILECQSSFIVSLR